MQTMTKHGVQTNVIVTHCNLWAI